MKRGHESQKSEYPLTIIDLIVSTTTTPTT